MLQQPHTPRPRHFHQINTPTPTDLPTNAPRIKSPSRRTDTDYQVWRKTNNTASIPRRLHRRDPVGRIVIGLYDDDTPLGASRLADLVTGRAGISCRKKQFVKIMPTYVQHGGVRSFGADAELAKRTGAELVNDALVEEWRRVSEECKGVKNLVGSVGIIVRDPAKPGPKTKLVAREGRLEIDEEEVRVEPNGTEFVIVTMDDPELDSKVLVVGRVVQGMDVVEKIGQAKTVQENTSSPYFRVAKLIGDKRAVVAERGFNRPYSKIVVTNCGLQE